MKSSFACYNTNSLDLPVKKSLILTSLMRLKRWQTKLSQKPVKPSLMSVKSPVVSLYQKTCLVK